MFTTREQMLVDLGIEDSLSNRDVASLYATKHKLSFVEMYVYRDELRFSFRDEEQG